MRSICFILFVSICMISCSDNPTEPPLEENARLLSADPVEFSTTDGFLIRGTFFHSSASTTPKPAVILLHEFNGSQIDWFAYAGDIVDDLDFVALAIDMRGHGASTFQNGTNFPIGEFSVEDLNNIPRDISASIAYLKTRTEVDASRIGIVGVDLGANVAFVGAGTNTEIKSTVSISPQFRENQAQGVLVGTNLPNFQPSNILYVAAFGDGYAYTSSQTMSNLTLGQTQVIGVQGLAHGMEVIANDETWHQILNWLGTTLP